VPTTITPPPFNPQPQAQGDSANSLPGAFLVTPEPEFPLLSATTSNDPASPSKPSSQPETWNLQPETSPAVMQPVNTLNTPFTPQIAATSTATTNYELPPLPEKKLPRLHNDLDLPIPLTDLIPPLFDQSRTNPPHSPPSLFTTPPTFTLTNPPCR